MCVRFRTCSGLAVWLLIAAPKKELQLSNVKAVMCAKVPHQHLNHASAPTRRPCELVTVDVFRISPNDLDVTKAAQLPV